MKYSYLQTISHYINWYLKVSALNTRFWVSVSGLYRNPAVLPSHHKEKTRMTLIRWYIGILWILLEPLFCCANTVIEKCPHNCSCDGDKLLCYDYLPEFIPRDTTEVAIHEAHLSDRLNFSDPFWREITHLTITAESKKQDAYKVIHENELVALQSLRTLRITCRCLTEIEKNAFRGLTNLIVLDLSENTAMSAEFIVQGLAGEDILPNLRELYLSNNQPVLGIVFNWVNTNMTNQTGHQFLEAI